MAPEGASLAESVASVRPRFWRAERAGPVGLPCLVETDGHKRVNRRLVFIHPLWRADPNFLSHLGLASPGVPFPIDTFDLERPLRARNGGRQAAGPGLHGERRRRLVSTATNRRRSILSSLAGSFARYSRSPRITIPIFLEAGGAPCRVALTLPRPIIGVRLTQPSPLAVVAMPEASVNEKGRPPPSEDQIRLAGEGGAMKPKAQHQGMLRLLHNDLQLLFLDWICAIVQERCDR